MTEGLEGFGVLNNASFRIYQSVCLSENTCAWPERTVTVQTCFIQESTVKGCNP